MKKYDAVIIGAGQAGVPLAKKLALAGKKTALIEKRWVGGTCINDGCTPTKTMIASARIAYLASHAAELGIHIPKVEINLKQIVSRKNKIVQAFRDGSEQGIEKTKNLNLIYGEAQFISENELEILTVSGKKIKIEASLIFINTGAEPVIPEIEGLDHIDYLTSTTILDLRKIPEHLLIVGGGYIALEMAQMFKRFGAKVTILEHQHRFMPHEDEDVCAEIRDILAKEKIKIYTSAEVIKVKNKGKSVSVNVLINKKITRIICSHILIATGRKPQTERLNLASAGVKVSDKGFIEVDAHLKTNKSHIYALGDVKGGPAFTHISYNDYIIVAQNLLENNKAIDTKNRIIPYAMFTDPQLGRIGITEEEAKEKGLNYKVAKIYNTQVARSIETGDTRGFMKAIVDVDSGQILGAAIISTEGGEIMSVLQMAMLGKITHHQLSNQIFAHPLYAESLNNLFMSLNK
jgi:pyruvate/2-oxoglutarate dehydrogenase complex dihydrolipoamide dehydrogenase (E3) component